MEHVLWFQENGRLGEELNAVKVELSKAEGSVSRLQRDLDQLLHDKVSSRRITGTSSLTSIHSFLRQRSFTQHLQ